MKQKGAWCGMALVILLPIGAILGAGYQFLFWLSWLLFCFALFVGIYDKSQVEYWQRRFVEKAQELEGWKPG